MALLEIACFTPDSAIQAYQAGADRIELCKDRRAGGTTPPLDSILQVKQHVAIPVFAMIRPRGDDFNYTDEEFQQMLQDIDSFKPMVDGFVFGMLTDRNDVDVVRTTLLVEKALPLPCTFHRACDASRDKLQALEDIIACGCQDVLTSGGAPTAAAGLLVLRELVESAGARTQVIVAGGVRANNIVKLREGTKAQSFHSSGVLGRDDCIEVDTSEVRQLKAALC